ncbi:hypothetical protein [Ammoniphilus sp. 3BR4]|uniref:hypothetical protein n=1 Tax=Ammoniphilus sp. 3BR4 TaxID=3158265 RepID=UPI0034655284
MSNALHTHDDFYRITWEKISDRDFRVLLFPNSSYVNCGIALQTFPTEQQAQSAARTYRDALEIGLENGYTLRQTGDFMKDGSLIHHKDLLDRGSAAWKELLQYKARSMVVG